MLVVPSNIIIGQELVNASTPPPRDHPALSRHPLVLARVSDRTFRITLAHRALRLGLFIEAGPVLSISSHKGVEFLIRSNKPFTRMDRPAVPIAAPP